MRAPRLPVVVGRGVRVIAPLTAGIVVVALIVVATAARRSAGHAQATPFGASSSSAAPASSTPESPVAVSSPAGLSSSPNAPESSKSAPLGSLSDRAAKLPVLASHWRDGGVAGFTPANPPQSTMIGGANDLLAVGANLLGATDQGIALSTDAGTTWRYVLTGVDLWSVTRAGSGLAALGRRGGPYENGPGVVATSPDGVTWRLIDPKAPPQQIVQFGYGDRIAATGVDAHAVDIAVPDIVATSVPGDTLRSIDGGRTWVATGMKLNTGIDVLPDGTTMYATGAANTASCAGGAVYRSTDAGAHWTLLPGSCQDRLLYAVTFVDADHGFAAGGTPTKYDGSDVVEATDDGGRTWQTRWSTPFDANYGGGGGFDNEIVRLAFADTQHGYALTGGCVDGQNGPCGGNLYVTSDAGHSWQPTGRTGLAVAAVGAVVYLTGTPQSDGPSLAISTDAGQHWTLHSNATQVTSQTVAGSGQTLWWQTNIGTFTSTDAGRHWTPSTAAAIGSLPLDADPLQAAPPGDLLALDRSTGTIWSSTDVATTARQSTLGAPNDVVQEVALGPGGRAAAIVGFNDNCSSPQLIAKMTQAKPGWQPETRPTTLYLSGDAGGQWQRQAPLPFPFSAFSPGSLAISPNLLVAIDACANLELSSDGGHNWATTAPAQASTGCTVALHDTEIWLDCPASVAHSTDAGVTWTTYTTNPGGVQQLSQPLEAVGPDSAIVSAAGSLWRTTDGGGHWTQTWPAVAGES